MTPSTKLLTALTTALLLLGAGAVAASGDNANDKRPDAADREKDDDRGEKDGKDEHHKSEFAKQGDKWLLRNDDISVWFHQTPSGKAKPMLRVFTTDADGNRSGYEFKIRRVCEVDANATDCDHAYAKMNLGKADNWNTQIERTNDTITIRMLLTDAQGVVGFVFHLDTNASTVKFDFDVANWRWKTDTPAHGVGSDLGVPGVTDHRLLLLMSYEERHKDTIDEDDADDANVSVKDGFISWEPTAVATYGLNQTRTLNVTAFHKLDHDDDEDEKEGHIALRFDGPGGYKMLAYDPTLGVASASAGSTAPSSIPAAGLVAAVAAVSVAVVALRRYR